MTNTKWARRFPNSANDFDLVLVNPQDLDFERLNKLLDSVLGDTHRGLTLSSRAVKEFQRWFSEPTTPLKSEAYVLLSNWFMTQSGDRHSMVASHCEELWDALFACRPPERLSSPAAGQNHVMVPAEFERFWHQVMKAQGEGDPEFAETSMAANGNLRPRTAVEPDASVGSTPDRLKAFFNKNGLQFQVEGSPRALADFLRSFGSE